MALHRCQQILTDSRIKVEESGRKAIFLNAGREEYIRTQIDGCLLNGARACDWAVSKPDLGDVLVELKGVNVSHAIDQLEAGAHYWLGSGLATEHLGMLIVCAQYPRMSTQVQRAQARFKKLFRAPLKVSSRNKEWQLSDLVKF